MHDDSKAPFLPFTRPSIGPEELDEVAEVLKSGWLATGPRTAQFETDLATYFQRDRALCLTSATAGLHLSLSALDLQPGDEVITVPMTFVATLNTIVQTGGTPVLVDVDPVTFNMDIEQLAAAVGPRTRAIVPVHFAGLPVDLDPLYGIAERHGLRVIEDCAHAIGAAYKGRLLGSFGDTQVFSFHPNKNMTTGEGGAVVSSDEDLLDHVALMRFHGIDRDSDKRDAIARSLIYDVPQPGYKYNMLDLQAALGLHQLARLDGFNERRRELADGYRAALRDWPSLSLPGDPGFAHRHAWHIFTVLVNEEASGLGRDDVVAALKTRGIGAGIHYSAAHLFSYYRNRFGFRPGQFPVAEHIGDHIMSLPLFPDMRDDDQARVVAALSDIVDNQGHRAALKG